RADRPGLCGADRDRVHLRSVLVPVQSLRHDLYVHVGALHLPALSLRSVDEAGMEVDDPAGDGQSAGDGSVDTRENAILGCKMSLFRKLFLVDLIEGMKVTFGYQN